MIQMLEAQGISLDSYKWDDGSDHDGISKIYVQCGHKNIQYIYFDYVKSGNLIERSRHGCPTKHGYSNMIEINHLENEHLESVTGTYHEEDGLQCIEFKSNFRTFEPIFSMGYTDIGGDTRVFTLGVKGKKIVGFHGTGDCRVNSLGAYFTWITPTRVEAEGGQGGQEWDDGYDHEDVSTVHVLGGFHGILSIQFDYVRNGKLNKGPLHGFLSEGYARKYEINYLQGEYLVSVEGYYDKDSRLIQGIQFKTNMKTFEMAGYPKGVKFTIAANGNKITGFHGYAERMVLISIGAYFTTTTCKLECVGKPSVGLRWDDGAAYDGIRKVFVDVSTSIRCIRFEYENRGKVIKTHRRADVENEEEFVIDYPNEFITSVEGSMKESLISSLEIKTSKGRTSPTFGDMTAGTRFVLEKQGNVLVGFHGTTGNYLMALGAYYRPLPPPPDAERLEAEGGDGGDYWDDGGAFDDVRRIFIGLTDNAIAFVKFMYSQNDRVVFGDDHGSKNLSAVQEFTLDDPAEYITSVEGNYDDESGVITMLRFNTSKLNSKFFGVGIISSFILRKNRHQIVGFHGKSSDMLHQIGVHVLPINFN